MQSLPLQSDLQNPSPSLDPTNPLKIKPLTRRFPRESQLNENNSQRSIKTRSKTLKAVRTDTDKIRGSSPRYIKGHIKHFIAQGSLSKLSCSFNWNRGFEDTYLFSKIRSFSNLTSLEIQCLTTIPLRTLFKSLVYLKNFAHFKLELNFYSFADPSFFLRLFHSLHCLRRFKSLSLSFVMCQNFDKVKIQNLPKYLSHLKHLQSFELNFDRPKDLSDPDIINLASVLHKLPLLTKISLSLGRYGRLILGSSLIKIFNNIRTLSDISLNLADFDVVSHEVTDPLVEGLRQLDAPSTQKLRLHVHKNLDSLDFVVLCQTFKRFTSLNLLHLNLVGSKCLTKYNFTELCSTLSCMMTLSCLSLKIPYKAKGISAIGGLVSVIKSLQNLVQFKLSFESDMESLSEEIPQLFESLMTLTCLKFLDVSFALQKSLTNNIVEKLSESLQKMVQLKHLILDFGDARPMGAQGVEFLINAIAKIHGLSFLDLNFGGISEVDKEVIEKVAEALRILPALYSANFSFIKCFRLKDNERSLSSFFDTLREMKNIREVVLHIPRNKINEQETNDLKQRKMLRTFWS